MTSAISTQPSRWKQAFVWALCIGLLLFIPFILFDKGYFIYYGDFNVQQIPFYKLAHQAVRSWDIGWSWYTDLGANFVGSYSFYLLFSPFFWITLPFPTSALPMLMAPLLVLKTACAALTACLYLERFVRDKAYAVAGSLLYAFSGWMLFNIFFNHFHDVAVFFPLLLWSLELLVCENKKGWFALAVLINAMVNYWFFVGEVVFVLLYVLVRISTKGWLMTGKKFFTLVWESVLGVGMAALVLAPSVMALAGNPRTGTDELLTGWNVWLYWHEQRYPAILHSLFFPPELPARPNFFPDHGAKWASLSAWLPLLGMTGVISYFIDRKNDWVKRLLALSLLFALIPGLNSLFILLNGSYYARWFYMPVLIMALASARALEDSIYSTQSFSRAIKWSVIIVAGFVVMSGLTPQYVEDKLTFGMAADQTMLWAYAITAAACLLLTALLVMRLRRSKQFKSYLCGGIALVSVVFGIFYMANGKNNMERSRFVVNTAIKGRYQLSLPEIPFARTDVYDDMDNIAMFWHLPNIQAFHSIVPPSIMEFYPKVGVKRDVGSRPEADYYALRPLLSVRWLFIHQDKEEQSPMPGYTLYSQELGFNVYENQNYIPLGFGYTHYVTTQQMEEVDTSKRSNLMLRAIVLEEEAAQRNQDILFNLDTQHNQPAFTEKTMGTDVQNRRELAAEAVDIDKTGFTAYTNLPQETLLFFSVPWEQGWSAKVNGEPALIEKVNVGFMAVRVPEGPGEIRFDYKTPGLQLGLAISGAFLAVFLLYWFACCRKKPQQEPPMDLLLLQSKANRMSRDEFLSYYGDQKERAARLQRVLNQASAHSIPDAIPQGERTLQFKPPEDDNTTNEQQ